jgi:hypothetical protein
VLAGPEKPSEGLTDETWMIVCMAAGNALLRAWGESMILGHARISGTYDPYVPERGMDVWAALVRRLFMDGNEAAAAASPLLARDVKRYIVEDDERRRHS